VHIVNVGYDSTNYYVLADTKPRLLIDVGMPGTLPKLQYQCKRADVALTQIDYLLCTHYHPDHAGIAQEVKNLGVKLILCEQQRAGVPVLRSLMKSQHHYVEIDLTNCVVIDVDQSRDFLAKVGLQGEMIHTPGHSDDSVTLVLDDGAAFTGDLPHPFMTEADSSNVIYQSWEKIRARNAKTIYPGHGPVLPLARLMPQNSDEAALE
jgi:endoribonuclease LACTB2